VTGGPAAGLVHGMGLELVEPDWPPLTAGEVAAVLAAWDGGAAAGAAVTWRSPRPMSAAGLVELPGRGVFVKRHHRRVRSPGQLAAEHAFAGHLRARGVPVPAVLRTAAGASVVTSGEFVYEVHERAGGVDLYRDALSWTPFTAAGHARAAGAALARLHLAAAAFPRRARPPAVLTGSCAVVTAADPLAAVARLVARRPGLARGLTGRPWQRDFAGCLLPLIGRAAPLLAALPRQWGHGDWHPSNLTWTSPGPDADVAAVLDLGLANRTLAVHDLATALERSTIGWLDLPGTGRAAVDTAAAEALLAGYESVRPLAAAEAAALPEALPVVHVEYALSEIEYFADVVESAANTGLAYGGYLTGHARWFTGPDGRDLLAWLRERWRTGNGAQRPGRQPRPS
jgi:Ser/Thr protein kinase RdoA (MazF antagonist)